MSHARLGHFELFRENSTLMPFESGTRGIPQDLSAKAKNARPQPIQVASTPEKSRENTTFGGELETRTDGRDSS
jgi:hypothetical protein